MRQDGVTVGTFFEEQLRSIVGEDRLLINEELSAHTTFKVGGPADFYAVPADEESLGKLVWYLNETGREFFLLGNGSNILVGDKGYRGTVIDTSSLNKIEIRENLIEVQAGALLAQTAQAAYQAGLSGLEFASGIPGSVGGAIVMNAGAYGSEMKDVTSVVRIVGKDGTKHELSCEDMQFGYRTSICRKDQAAVLSVRLSLKEGDPAEIAQTMKELAEKRRNKQPLELPSAGSTFKRPEGYFAGKLIMDAGLSGLSIGGAKVSEKHCGFIVNTGNATAADIADLIAEVQEKVADRFGVKLEPEVCMIGEF